MTSIAIAAITLSLSLGQMRYQPTPGTGSKGPTKEAAPTVDRGQASFAVGGKQLSLRAVKSEMERMDIKGFGPMMKVGATYGSMSAPKLNLLLTFAPDGSNLTVQGLGVFAPDGKVSNHLFGKAHCDVKVTRHEAKTVEGTFDCDRMVNEKGEPAAPVRDGKFSIRVP
jgi:hypothetical protein